MSSLPPSLSLSSWPSISTSNLPYSMKTDMVLLLILQCAVCSPQSAAVTSHRVATAPARVIGHVRLIDRSV